MNPMDVRMAIGRDGLESDLYIFSRKGIDITCIYEKEYKVRCLVTSTIRDLKCLLLGVIHMQLT